MKICNSSLELLDIGNTVQLTGAVWSGNGQTYLIQLPGEDGCDRDDLVILYPSSADWEMLLRQSDLMETEVLTRAADGAVAKAIMRKSTRVIDQGTSWKVYKRDHYACRYCGADDVPLTVDHLVLWEYGGPSTEANLVTACRKCNRIRGNMRYEDWLEHPRYKDVSRKLNPSVREANIQLVQTLAMIPRMAHVRSR